MEQILITRIDGSTFGLQSKTAGSSITNAVQTVELLGADTIDITVVSATKLVFSIGDKTTIIGKPYTLNTPAKEKKTASNQFTYDLQFEGVQYDLLRASYSVNVDTTSNQIQDLNGDSLTGDFKRFLDVLISNANRVFPGKWSLGTYPTVTETVTETFSETDNCLSVLQTLCGPDKYNTEFSISVALNGHRTLNVGAIGVVMPFTFEYGQGRGIYDLTREKQSSSNIITRLSVFGSSKNIMSSKYKIGETFRGLKLCLPTKTKANSILENTAAIAKYGVWESIKTFEDIFPHRNKPITALGSSELKFVDSTMEFDLNATDGNGNTLYRIPGTPPKVHFNSGNLAGYEFEVVGYDHATKTFTLLPFTDENGYTFPSSTTEAFQFKVGDEFSFIDIYMPQSYIDEAEAKLQTAGQAYLDKYSQPFVQYGLTVDSFFLKNVVGAEADTNIIWAGDYVPIKDADIEVDKTIRVKGFTRDLLKDYSYSLTIADLTTSVSIINRVITELKDLDTIVKINSLNDPARARRNYKATLEVVTMLEAVQAEAALIGNNPASQYELSGVFIRANYNKNANTIDITAGALAHNYYPVGNPGTWNISAANFAGLTSGTAYYVYIKASKTASTAVYYISSTKIEVESVAGYYHFPLGVLSSVIDGARVFTTTKGYTLITGDSIKTGRISSNDGSKYFDLTTGEFKGAFTFTNGTSVETSIEDAIVAANEAYTYADDAFASAGNAQATADGIQVGGRNILHDGAFKYGMKYVGASFGSGTILDIQTDAHFGNVLRSTAHFKLDNQIMSGVKQNEDLTLSFFAKATAPFVLTMAGIGFDDGSNKLLPSLTFNLTTSWQLFSVSISAIGDQVAGQKMYFYSTNDDSKPIYLVNLKLERGNKPTDFTPAPEDTQEDIQTSVSNIKVGGRNLVVASNKLGVVELYGVTGTIEVVPDSTVLSKQSFKISSIVRTTGNLVFYFPVLNNASMLSTSIVGKNIMLSFYIKANNAQLLSGWGMGADISIDSNWKKIEINATYSSGNMHYLLAGTGLSEVWIHDLKIEFGNKATDWTPAPEDVPDSLQYLAAALQGSTDISGGLVGTNVLLLKSLAGDVTGGLSGLNTVPDSTDPDNIGFWTGGSYQDAINSIAKIILRKDGSGQLAGGKILWDLFGALSVGNFKIENGAIVGYADNKDKVKLHTGAISTLSAIGSGGWVTANDKYNITPPDIYGDPIVIGETINNSSNPAEQNYTRVYQAGGMLTVPANTTIKIYQPSVPTCAFSPTTSLLTSSVSYAMSIYRNGTLIGTYTPSISGTSVVLTAGGDYNITYTVTVNFTVKKYSAGRLSVVQGSDVYITYQLAVERTEIGKDGFYSYWSNLMYMYFNSATGLEVKGATNMPGVLASGTISSGGTQSNRWGAKTSGSNATYTATGIYDVPHAAGATYQLMIMPSGDGQNGFVVSKGNNTFRVQIRNNSGTAAAGAFDYIIVGTN